MSSPARVEGAAARACLVGNLRYALGRFERTILIEPICRAAIPGYFLSSLDQAADILGEVGHPRLKILFDCYHVETEHGGCIDRFLAVAPVVGHVQIASVPGRNEPTEGALDYADLLPAHAATPAMPAPSAASTVPWWRRTSRWRCLRGRLA